MQEHFEFDREKFKDVVHFAIHHAINTHGSDAIGNTKLHKIAYYADILHYLETGQPLTGADYQRQKFGPTARHLSWALVELKKEKRISVNTSNYYGYAKRDYANLVDPASNRLNPDEVGLIKHVSDFVCVQSASEISEFSHDDVWASVPMGKRIPYYAALVMFPCEITGKDLEEITTEAMSIAPLIEAELRERNAN